VRPYRATVTLLAVFVLTLSGPLLAQQAKPAPQPAPPSQPETPPQPAPVRPRLPLVPLEVQVVISRYQGEKRISTMPYVLAVNANAPQSAQLNIGAEVPIPSPSPFAPAMAGDNKPGPALMRSYNYRSIGTIIECRASSADDGRFEVSVNVDESSVYTGAVAGLGDGPPAFRSFKSRNMLVMRDGQTRQYTAATDRASGETFKVEVTMKVVK
jgi:hypothetical protein